MSIPDLLQRSREAHLRYRESIPRRIAQGAATVGDPAIAVPALFEAYRLLAEAHVLDPRHTVPEWRPEDEALLSFYNEQLSR